MNHFMLVMFGTPVPAGETYDSFEVTNGELGFYAVSDGKGKPYRLRVPVVFEEHSHFTPHFRRSLIRDVQSALTAALGRRAEDVKAEPWEGPAAEDDPVMAAFEAEGFGGLEAVKHLDGRKTHVLRIRYEQGLYVLEARQYDGSTGYATPLVRQRETRERALVGRLAALMIARETGQTYERVVKDTQRNFWMSAEQAVEYGLVGKIISDASEV